MGRMGRPKSNTPAMFWEQTKRVADCLEWQGSRIWSGYGKTTFRGKTTSAHRLAWMLTYGPIPEGMLVCHKCDNRPCVEPTHLFLGTWQDNLDDAVAKGRLNQSGEASHFARLTERQVLAIRKAAATGLTIRSLGRVYGVHESTIRLVVNRKTWQHI